MYGLILENLSQYVIKMWGEDKWEEIRKAANVQQCTFTRQQVYEDALIPKLSASACEVKTTRSFHLRSKFDLVAVREVSCLPGRLSGENGPYLCFASRKISSSQLYRSEPFGDTPSL
ncbi:hypothetical protein AVEN_83906-1 [Araneus ventricosus]|uniref:Heme NO-binding domain-containing protein n=1 Tax=Araneus ventricosus TaxID=182803 RepID=A0A4Y2I4T6_ARAVE|nr:hypothetical protein AVEN_83906-1 [Araneus ventricosus]